MSLSPSLSIKQLGTEVEFPCLLVVSNKKELLKKLSEEGVELFKWQEESLVENTLNNFEVSKGKLGVLILNKKNEKEKTPGLFKKDSKAICRDIFGSWFKFIGSKSNYSLIALKSVGVDAVEGLGAGAVVSSYVYKDESIVKVKINLDKKSFNKGVELGESINSARWLVDSPPNKLTPESFKNLIVNHFKKAPKFEVKILNKAQLKKAGYGLISAVGQGSETGPYIVHVSYKGKAKKESIGMVGKGITFDTGGLDLKPSKFMRWMKKDMGGAASLFGVAHWVRENKPKENFDFVFAIAENSVSKEAVRPGDVMHAKNGLSVEMHNTDAEGRLAMASGLNYLSSLNKKFSHCFDIATLTGAIKVGLDDRVAGLFSNDMSFGASVAKASEKAHDPLWLMPMPYWTRSAFKSTVADYVNAKDGYGGAIGAAEFLKLFIPKDTPWCHLDIYAWTDSKRDSYLTKGATGQSVQALCEWIANKK